MEACKPSSLCRNCAVNSIRLFLLVVIYLLVVDMHYVSLLGDNDDVETSLKHFSVRFYDYRVARQQTLTNWSREQNMKTSPQSIQVNESRSCIEESASGFDDSGVEMRFEEKCGWWLDAIGTWRERLMGATGDVEHLLAVQERSGTGDRLMGAMTAFYHAVHRGSKLTITWDTIDEIFQPSCRLRDKGQSHFKLSGEKTTVLTRNCVPRSTYYSCGVAEHRRDHCPIYNRACMQTRHCQSMNRAYDNSLTMAHVIGCPLRLMFQPTARFLGSQVRWFNDGAFHNGTVLELLHVLESHYIVASHTRLVDTIKPLLILVDTCLNRMGDRAMRASISQNKKRNREVVSDLDLCHRWVSDYAVSLNASRTVKWLIASDDDSIRNHFKKEFPNQTITLDHDVNHISKVTKRGVDDLHKFLMLKNLFAEWFILGRADELISNNVHNFGVSSFSRSAWLYNLKSQYYELRTRNSFCYKREYSFQGNTGTVSKECSKVNHLLKSDLVYLGGLPQPHLPTNQHRSRT